MSVCLYVCLWFSHANTTEPISMTFCTKIAYSPGIYIGLFPLRHISPLQDGSLNDVTTTCKIGTFYNNYSLLYKNNALVNNLIPMATGPL